jgi:hypothetical protein
VEKVTDIDSPSRKKLTRSAQSALEERERWEKAIEAYQLLLGGKSHSEIAEILGITYVDDVWRLLTERFKYDAARLTEAERKDLLALETLRLNALQAAVWPAAMMGDPKSVDSAVKIISARAKINGLEQVDPVINKHLVLVVGEKEEEYIASLKASESD